MSPFSSKAIGLALLCTSLMMSPGIMADEQETTAEQVLFNDTFELRNISPRSGEKIPVRNTYGDLEFTLGGTVKFDSWFAKNVVLLNKNLPDEYGYLKQTFDLTGSAIWGLNTFNHKAFELFFDIRQKAIFGNGGREVQTTKDPVKLGDSVVGTHSHRNNKLVVWLRGLYAEVSINALFGRKDEKYLHFLKVGHFPFILGRGIALGPVYGVGRDFLGLQTTYLNDTQTPGINLRGELCPGRLYYDLYYAKLEENSAGFSDNFSHIKASHVGRSLTPWRGVAQDNDLIAARLKWTAINTDRSGVLDIEPYILYNEQSDRQLEIAADAKLKLATGGLALEYKNKNFEFGGEVAVNYGEQLVRHIDRNVVKIKPNKDGKLCETLSHVVYEKTSTDEYGNTIFSGCPDDSSPVVRSQAIKSVVSNARKCGKIGSCYNGHEIGQVTETTFSCDDTNASCTQQTRKVFNACNRFRPAFKNNLRGWMAVADASYFFENVGVKWGLAYGYASGDDNPNLFERDTTFNGFIGLLEGYAGKRVQSVFVLDSRKLKRPLALGPNEREAGDDGSFTDLHHVGTSLNWYPLRKKNQLHIGTNLMFFWKAHAINAFDQCSQKTLCRLASTFLGTEWNLRLKYEALKDFYIFGDVGMFFPGKFYDDISGIPLRGDIFNRLDRVDRTGVDSSNYRLSNDFSYLVNLGMHFKF